MSHCFNPECLSVNPDNSDKCDRCGMNLRLQQRYRAIKILGQGGFGRTFLAIDEKNPSNPTCVVKQFFPQAQGTPNLQRAALLFEQEAVRLDELGEHPQIPNFFNHFTEGDRQYLVQEFIDGKDLAIILIQEGAFSETKVKDLLWKVLPVLDYIHRRNVIHRDIKPTNLIRRQDGKYVLVDFGAAKYVSSSGFLITGTTIGSAGYAAPEQVMGKAQPGSDIYSLGVTCAHLLTQVAPFELFDISENDWVWREYLPNPISDRLGKLLDKMLVQATKKRYQSAANVLRDLSKLSETRPNSPAIACTYLEALLAVEEWEAADRETVNLMLRATHREREGWLRALDVRCFPSGILSEIDRLWLEYSHGHFGLSVQAEIYHGLGGTKTYDRAIWEQFGDRVGWRRNRSWLRYNDLLFNLHFPVGHLETNTARGHLPAAYVFNCVDVGVELLDRVATCNARLELEKLRNKS